ncbi:MAG: hypothetical protein Q7V31_12095 [Parvibaculum sp.]|uniref:hypothetical protein n=1 Tax=Parvibaculum sp. TaxID=2024848 RepID=UPI002724593D|nr:hypothetical protein [Parvibaculum sp.]MDO8839658.1 hypothetical protein [Parvibaculum sp.]
MPSPKTPQKPAEAPPPAEKAADAPDVGANKDELAAKARRTGTLSLRIPLSTPGSTGTSLNVPR